jgi:hypothetical protein
MPVTSACRVHAATSVTIPDSARNHLESDDQNASMDGVSGKEEGKAYTSPIV